MYYYQAFKFPIHSELALPELLPITEMHQAGEEVITIKFGAVNPDGLNEPSTTSFFYQVTPHEVWLQVPSIARFLISNGNQITIDPVAGIDEDSLRVFILGSCMGALLIQRDLFVLHGSAIKIGDHCISLVGHSGAGKSSLTGAFFKRGYTILTDDICAVTAQGNVLPSFPQLALWLDAAKHLGIEVEPLRKIRARIQKFAVPLAQQFHDNMLPLKAIYVLHSHKKKDYSLELMTGVKKLQPLQNLVYKKPYLRGLEKEKSYVVNAAKVAQQAAVIHFMRPEEEYKLDHCVDLVEKNLIEIGLQHGWC